MLRRSSQLTSFASALALALGAAVAAPRVHATTSLATEPVGFMRYNVSAGLQTIGFPLVNAPVARGRVESTEFSSLFAANGTPIASRLDPQASYYLEFTAGPDGDTTFVGDRLEVDVGRTTAAANPAHRVRLQLGSALSTLRTLPAELVGYRFVIRPHVTLAQALGTGAGCVLRGGQNTANGDQAYLLQNGVFSCYLLQADETTGARRWVKFPDGNAADDLPIAPGAGLFLRHVGRDGAMVRHVGRVRTNAFVQPLIAGYTLASEPFPVASTFATRGMTDANGFVAGNSAESADSVSLWTGADYRVLFYAASGAQPAWRSSETITQSEGTGSHEAGSATDFSPFGAVLIQKLAADPDYVVPSPL